MPGTLFSCLALFVPFGASLRNPTASENDRGAANIPVAKRGVSNAVGARG